MAPVASPAVWNPIAPIQNNWGTIEPIIQGYTTILGGLGTIFALGATLALIAEHKGKLPKWPFTAERWNPKPTVDSDKKQEISEDDIVEDELAQAAGTLNKRSLNEDDLEWFNDEILNHSFVNIFRRDGTLE
jgi:hypothetical protein